MEFFKDIRLKIGKTILAKRLVKTRRNMFYSNISLVKTIGIVWDASKPNDFLYLTRFYQKMHERNIEVKILGYFPGKNLPDQYTALRYLTFIRKKEINFFYHPVSSEANTFLNNRFDILIDINFKKVFTLQYITLLSNAALKVGLFESDTDNSPFDLMMEMKDPVSIEKYLNEIVQYLEMIKSETFKTVYNN